ncbi:(d)CMP kinase [Bartonella sp. HY329]|uniref:(d)CMP kinase n=1 Tax=unclassified Bartonella TaxID=2645622 RepID=UPI0021C5B8FB|nr:MULTISPECIES: (d)CMP kinase [unclassified Bartonella]UXM95248.1 (d)CMP kinase [Bartonella sp. HY329]UXN09572.1 (d)CMP kinase [Bartonella sp. HY328]
MSVNNNTEKTLIIAIDGPAASGKGTLARMIAEHYQLPHLDTGLTYRAVAHKMLEDNLPLDDEETVIKTAESVDFSKMDRAILSNHLIGEAASKIAVFPKLRRALVNAQRQFAKNGAGAVLDGRDIGTVVCPDATVKFFVTALVEVRAKRRFDEIVARGGSADLTQIETDLIERDARDSNRAEGPLKQAQDAYLLDTTKLSIETAFVTACQVIDTSL